LQDVESVGRQIEPADVRYRVQASLCGNLTELAIQLSDFGISDDELHKAIGFLFGMVREPNLELYSGTMVTLVILYQKLCDKFVADEVVQMLDIIRVGLGSGVADVISDASVLLSTIFLFSGSGVSDCLGEFLSLEVELLRSHEEMQLSHPFIVKAIVSMFEGAGESANRYEQELFD
jgi:hypothetical protein